MSDYRKLNVWQEARSLVTTCYRATASFPDSERYGLANQIRRAAVSVPANIAEGAERLSAREFRRFLRIARASASELECLMVLAADLGFLEDPVASVIEERIQQVRRMIAGLSRSIRFE